MLLRQRDPLTKVKPRIKKKPMKMKSAKMNEDHGYYNREGGALEWSPESGSLFTDRGGRILKERVPGVKVICGENCRWEVHKKNHTEEGS